MGSGQEDGGGAPEDRAAEVEQPSEEMREIFGLGFPAVEHFAQMLVAEGELRGLVGPRELPRLWSRHLVNSAAVGPFLPSRGTVADVGSGAGFPGIIVAIIRPDLEVSLIETMERRVAWLSDVVEELGLDNVTIHRARAEEMKEKYDAVTAPSPTSPSSSASPRRCSVRARACSPSRGPRRTMRSATPSTSSRRRSSSPLSSMKSSPPATT